MLLNYLILLPLKEEQIIKKVKQTFQIQRRLAFSTKMAKARPAARHESCRSARELPLGPCPPHASTWAEALRAGPQLRFAKSPRCNSCHPSHGVVRESGLRGGRRRGRAGIPASLARPPPPDTLSPHPSRLSLAVCSVTLLPGASPFPRGTSSRSAGDPSAPRFPCSCCWLSTYKLHLRSPLLTRLSSRAGGPGSKELFVLAQESPG